jgi:hypothetical protein
MRIPRLKMRQALILIAVASVWLWLQRIDLIVLACGIIVLTLMLVSLRNRERVAVEIKAEGIRTWSLSRAGIICYSIAIMLAIVWVASIWTWQVIEHETSKLLNKPAGPILRAKL